MALETLKSMLMFLFLAVSMDLMWLLASPWMLVKTLFCLRT